MEPETQAQTEPAAPEIVIQPEGEVVADVTPVEEVTNE